MKLARIALAALLLSACSHPTDNTDKAKVSTRSTLVDDFRLVEGDAEGRAHGAPSFAAIAQGSSANVETLKSEHGATLMLGGRAKVWLREGSEATLFEDGEKHLVIDVARGEARVRSYGSADEIVVGTEGGAMPAESTDVLVRRRDGGVDVTPTARAQEGAAWTLPEGDAHAATGGIGSLTAKLEDEEQNLALRRVKVTARVEGDVAETVVEHTFHNDGATTLEGTFRFPLPEGATLVGLAMEIDGKIREGEFVEIDKARRIYQETVDEMRDPAILEWEHGSTFKVRVWPIAAHADKRIAIRYVAPLARGEGKGARSYVYPASPRTPLTEAIAFSVAVDGKVVVDKTGFVPSHEIIVPLVTEVAPVTVEKRDDGTYLAVRVKADRVLDATEKDTAAARALIVVCDTSRSALEGRVLIQRTLATLLGELGPRDRFAVVAADVDVRDASPELLAYDDANAAQATKFLADIEPDGASDLGAALQHAGAIAARAHAADASLVTQVVYVGDGRATWGETDADALASTARKALDGSSFAALLIGDADVAGMTALAQGVRGFVAQARSPVAVQEAAIELAHPGSVQRMYDVAFEVDHGDVASTATASMRSGDEQVVLVHVAPGAPLPTRVHVTGEVGAQATAFDAAIEEPAPTRHVARRWAAAEIARLEGDATKKDEVVKLSTTYGVLSKQTALLVLENEEAYRKHDIARKNAKERADEPKVTGADLESLNGGAHLSMDRVQPGDPELFIPAPADARSVVAVFPWGETKDATFEVATGQWSVRFLVGLGTPDGTQTIVVRVTRADGSVELLHMPYVVDTTRPDVEVSLTPSKAQPGAFEVRATQVLDDAAIARARADGAMSNAKAREKLADLQRVQVRFPDGVVVALDPHGAGDFRGVWTPREPPSGAVKLHVVAFDKALNQTALDVDAQLAAGAP